MSDHFKLPQFYKRAQYWIFSPFTRQPDQPAALEPNCIPPVQRVIKSLIRCQMSLGVLGCGQIGRALLRGILDSGKMGFVQVFASTRTSDLASLPWIKKHKVVCLRDGESLAVRSDIIIIGLPSNQAREVLVRLRDRQLFNGKLLISVVASISCHKLASWDLGTERIVRVMPNTPSEVCAGTNAICGLAPEADLLYVKGLMDCVGSTFLIQEELWAGWTPVAGCGPAYCFLFIQAVADALVCGGIPRNEASDMAAHIIGSYALSALRNGHQMPDNLSEPGLAALQRLKELGYGGISEQPVWVAITHTFSPVMQAVQAARDRGNYLENHPES